MHEAEREATVPLFIAKLWNMVEDPDTNDIISWNPNGRYVLIQYEDKLSRMVLPQYFKHNNLSTFIRQLNMYGFRKTAKPDLTNQPDCQFFHPNFQKGKKELLKNIKRKSHVAPVGNNEQLTQILSDVNSLRVRQNQVDATFRALKHENTVLWKQLAILRQKHQTQQQIVNKLIHFLVTIVPPSTLLQNQLALKRPLMIDDGVSKRTKSDSSGLTIHELDNSDLGLREVNIDECALENVQIPSPADKGDQNPVLESATGSSNDFVIDQSPVYMESTDDLYAYLDLLDDSTNNIQTVQIPEFYNNDIDTANAGQIPNTQDEPQPDIVDQDCTDTNTNSEGLKTDVVDNDSSTNNLNEVVNENLPFNLWQNKVDDLGNHMGMADNELEQIKNMINGCDSIDDKYLLQLFNTSPSYDVPIDTWDSLEDYIDDPGAVLDDPWLFDIDSGDSIDIEKLKNFNNVSSSTDSLETPKVKMMEPDFSTPSSKS